MILISGAFKTFQFRGAIRPIDCSHYLGNVATKYFQTALYKVNALQFVRWPNLRKFNSVLSLLKVRSKTKFFGETYMYKISQWIFLIR